VTQEGPDCGPEMLTSDFRESVLATVSHVDDEYEFAAVRDPRLFLTTSREPSARLVQFAKELSLVFPNCQRKNRGGHVIGELVDACRSNDITDLVLVYETRGEPDTLVISHLPHGPTAYFGLMNCVFRHDIPNVGTMSLQFPHLVFDNFTTPLGERTMNILKHLFPVPKEDSRRVVTLANRDDFISFRHHMYQRQGKEVVLQEVGPRFEMRLFQIRLGTVENDTADVEWALRPYMNTSKKRNFL
jgi:U3 small nucleolar ribonucleoprotein protein IMP4